MKTEFISIFTVVLLLTLILFSRTSSSSSSLTFSSSDCQSQVMQGRYILPYTQNTTGDMRIASSNLIVLGNPVICRAVNYRLTKHIYKKTF